MPSVFWRQLFAKEDMSQMRIACGAFNFCSLTVGISNPTHGALDFIVEAGPSASSTEFVYGSIQFCAAPAAGIGPVRRVRLIFSAERSLGSFVYDDTFFLRSEWRPFGGIHKECTKNDGAGNEGHFLLF